MLEGGGIAAPLAIFPALNAAAANIFKNIINISIIDIYFIKFLNATAVVLHLMHL